jgi:2-polyprenyl-6-methoxyphenol hydroxylase-like FAD-dependent oxidoreductase
MRLFNTHLNYLGRHALVIGASIAGLLTARILSDYFEDVTVVERDHLPTNVHVRKGVPQGRHVHLLMEKGAAILSELFPTLFSDLEKDGALLLSPTADFRWFHFGFWKLQFPGPLRVYSQSRPLLEHHVCRHVVDRPNIRMLDDCEVTGLIRDVRTRSTISGARIRRCYHMSNEEYLMTDLIVDASGRGSQTPFWLATLGYPPIEETLVKIDVGYATRVYRRPESAASHWKAMAIYPWPLDMKRIGYIFPIEQNEWIVTLSGHLHDHPPADEVGFLAFARNLAMPHIYEAIKVAEPLSPIFIHKFPANRWRHYERLSRMPDGLVVLGDAACVFNPVYGQGMTVACLEANILRVCLEHHLITHAAGDMTGFSRRFQKALANGLEVPWLFATSEDFRYPETEGKRPLAVHLLQSYTHRVSNLTASEPFVTQRFYEVLNMVKPPSALFHPRILIPTLSAHQAAAITDKSPSLELPRG